MLGLGVETGVLEWKMFLFYRDYPQKILEKLKEYTKVKRILRQSNTRHFGLLGLESTTKMD